MYFGSRYEFQLLKAAVAWSNLSNDRCDGHTKPACKPVRNALQLAIRVSSQLQLECGGLSKPSSGKGQSLVPGIKADSAKFERMSKLKECLLILHSLQRLQSGELWPSLDCRLVQRSFAQKAGKSNALPNIIETRNVLVSETLHI